MMTSATDKSSDIFDVSGSVVIVTGGASGLGLSVAEVMAANNARVLILDVDQTRLETCRDQFADRGLSLDIATVDVADIQALQAVIHDTAERHGRLDAVYANAGISVGSGPFPELGQLANFKKPARNRVFHNTL